MVLLLLSNITKADVEREDCSTLEVGELMTKLDPAFRRAFELKQCKKYFVGAAKADENSDSR